MKNGLLVWNIVLTLAAGYLLFAHFNNKGTSADTKKIITVTDDSTRSASGPFRIAYFEMDSLENSFDMVKDVKGEINKREEEYNKTLEKLTMPLRTKYSDMQNAKSQAELEAIQQELKTMDDNLKVQRQDMDQKFQDFVTRKNLSVRKKVEEFLAEYNKSRNYTYIIAYEQGLFYYKDTAYDITSDVIRGLNVDYAKNKNKAD